MKLLDILAGIIAILVFVALAFVTGKEIGVGMGMMRLQDASILERRIQCLEEKISQLEDRMDRAALGLSNRVYRYQPFGFRFEGPTNIVVRNR